MLVWHRLRFRWTLESADSRANIKTVYIYCMLSNEAICLSVNSPLTHPRLSYFVKPETRLCFSNRQTSINPHSCQWERWRSPSSERICFMSDSYWIWISFIILFLILKVTLAFGLISSWYAGPIALLLLLGGSEVGWASCTCYCDL